MTISMNQSWQLTKNHISDILKDCKNAKELFLVPHLESCLEWGLKLKPGAGCALKISLYGHDIERAFKNRANRRDYSIYRLYKQQHSINSANYLTKYLIKVYSAETLINEVSTLVRYHDVGYPTNLEKSLYKGLRVLRDADTIALFEDKEAIKYYIKVNGIDYTEAKIRFMYGKFTRQARERPEVVALYKQAVKIISEERKKSTLDELL